MQTSKAIEAVASTRFCGRCLGQPTTTPDPVYRRWEGFGRCAPKGRRRAEGEERPSPVGIVGAVLQAATLAIIVIVVRRTVLARRRAFEALHSTRTSPVAGVAR